MLLPLPVRSLTKGRIDFREFDFSKIIAQKGLLLRWSQSAPCPCSSKTNELNLDLEYVGAGDTSIDTQYNPACVVCQGNGTIYHSPQTVQGIVASAEGDYLNARFGGYRDGMINITLEPEHLPSFGDKFEMLDSVMLYQESLDDNGLDVLALRFPIVPRTMTLATGDVTRGVMYATYSDAATRQASGIELVEGVDFTVNDGAVNWVNKPAGAGKFSFNYFMHPTYTCVAFANSMRDTHVRRKSLTDNTVALPVRVQCKLEFLGGDNV